MKSEEDRIQAGIVMAVRYQYPKSEIFAVPNGGFRSKATAGILKATGVRAGVSDLIMIHDEDIYFIEVKTENGKQSPAQKDFQRAVEGQGFKYFIVKSAEETLNILKNL